MDHVVYLDAAAKEMVNILAGKKTMILRGATGRKMPYGRVEAGDMLYFLNNDAEGLVKARASVVRVLNSDALTEEGSLQLINEHLVGLQLTEKQLKRWGGKRYLVLIWIEKAEEVKPFRVDKNAYGNMDDWLPVGKIESVMQQG
jgi:hypothetical protein